MGLIKEPLDVDFFVESTALTNLEKKQNSEYIREYNTKQDKEFLSKRKVRRASVKKKVMN